MYSAFQLQDFEPNYSYTDWGLEVTSDSDLLIKESLERFIDADDGVINGHSLSQKWFPKVKADVFISHSHRDRRKALALAGWLEETFGLVSFIDSCIWGHSDKLLRMIDHRYCTKEGKNTFDYQKRNFSTSHIHLMLATALSSMIDATECVIFLNTPNSISPQEVIEHTVSPWLYYELATTQTIRRWSFDELVRHRTKTFSKGMQDVNEHLQIKYRAPIKHLININNIDLVKWETEEIFKDSDQHALDILYNMKMH